MKYYAVFDTNVLVASLLTKHPDSPTALVVDAISEEKLIPLYNEEILEEYDDVLHRAKFPFSNDAIQNIMQMIRQFGLAISPVLPEFPKVKDTIYPNPRLHDFNLVTEY